MVAEVVALKSSNSSHIITSQRDLERGTTYEKMMMQIVLIGKK